MATVEIINDQIVIKFDDSEHVYKCIVSKDDDFFVNGCNGDFEEFKRIFTNPIMIKKEEEGFY